MSVTHPDGIELRFKRGQLLVTRVIPGEIERKYYDSDVSAWVTRYKPAFSITSDENALSDD